MKAMTNKLIDYWIFFWSMVFLFGAFIGFLEIVVRFCFSYSLDLFFDIPVWCTVWSTLLVAGPVLLKNEHVGIDAITCKLSGKAKKIVNIINAAIVLVFGVLFTCGGYLFVLQLYNFNTAYTRSISIPSWIVEACVPIGLFIFTLCALYNLYIAITANPEEDNDCPQ